MNTNPLNQRPTQAPLDREAQQKAFQERQSAYFQKPAETAPIFPVQPQKIERPPETTTLQTFQQILEERGLQYQAEKVKEHVQENKTASTVKQFYCRHTFTPVRATFMSLPIRYKICNKCGLVK